ncbi:unnamed protein product [Phytophthora lilii]|uniref:Unnamed protein product n=1 Tax=Phytophthora lilii TaxID=2077276 RepID=A0A9W6WPL9_9STRA|nr:unnamed protein product [Phytophthora lilii]
MSDVLFAPTNRGAVYADLGLHVVEKALALRARHVGGLGKSLTYIVATVHRKEHRVSSMSFTGKFSASGKGDKDNKDGIQDQGVRSTRTIATPVSALLGHTSVSPSATEAPAMTNVLSHEVALVNSYELIRLGYLVFGDQYQITFDEWDILSSMAPFRAFCHFWNHRVLVWTLRPVTADGDAEIAGGRALQSTEPQMWRLDDPRLQQVHWWQVSASLESEGVTYRFNLDHFAELMRALEDAPCLRESLAQRPVLRVKRGGGVATVETKPQRDSPARGIAERDGGSPAHDKRSVASPHPAGLSHMGSSIAGWQEGEELAACHS